MGANGKSEHPSNTVSKFELLVQSVTDYAIAMQTAPFAGYASGSGGAVVSVADS